MKRFFGVILCLGFLFCLGGCKNHNNAADLEKILTENIVKSGYVRGSVNGSVKTEIDGMGEQTININDSFETDFSSGFPISKMSGTVGMANLVSMPFELTLNEEKAEITIFGQKKTYDIDENKRDKIKTAVKGISSHQWAINKEVKETTLNDTKALEIVYDKNQLNSILDIAGGKDGQTKIENLKLYYILTDEDDIDKIIVELSVSGRKKAEINAELKLSSIGKD